MYNLFLFFFFLGYADPTWYSSSSDWLKITPFGMNSLLQWIAKRYSNPPVIITENGISDASGNLDDLTRVYYYKHYINSMLKGISLITNFEKKMCLICFSVDI